MVTTCLHFSFLVHPLSNIRRAINELYATGLTGSQKPNDIDIHDCQFRQVQNRLATVLLELLLQFLDVFQLKVTNQTNRGLSALGILFDPQCSARFRNIVPI